MNRAWMALAGLAMVGVVALWHQDPGRAPLLVADSASPGECRAWQERARAQERHRQGWFAIFEGFSTLQGLCHPQNIARGRDLIEGAIATGLDPSLAVDYTIALQKVGETEAAEEWATLSVYVDLHRIVTTALIPFRSPARWAAIEPAYRASTTDRTWQKELADIEHLLSRPPKVPVAEATALDHLIGRLSRDDRIHADYLRYLAHSLGRLRLNKEWAPRVLLSSAARCGHPDAIRAYGKMALAGELEEGFNNSAVMMVAWLHHNRTRQEGDLLVALLTKFGPASWRSAGDGMIRYFDGQIVRYCAPLKHVAMPSIPGD